MSDSRPGATDKSATQQPDESVVLNQDASSKEAKLSDLASSKEAEELRPDLASLESANDIDDIGGDYSKVLQPAQHSSRISDSDLLKCDVSNLSSICLVLRYHRLKKGISVSQMAVELKTNERSVIDLEEGVLLKNTYLEYATPLLKRYAKAVQMNPFRVLECFELEIQEQITRIVKEEEKTDRQMNRNWLLMVLMILVATAGYFVFGGESKEDKSSGSIQNPNSQVQVQEPSVAVSEPLVTGKMTFNEGNDAASEQVVIEDPNNAQAQEVKVVDPNTARATAQAQALAEQAAKVGTSTSNDKQPSSLALPKDMVSPPSASPEGDNHASDVVLSSNQGTSVSAALKDQVKIQGTQASGLNSVENQDAEQANKAAQETAAKEAEAQEAKAQELAKSKEAAAKAQAEAQAKAKEESVELKDKLTDISSKVKVVDREGLASLNSAELNVTKQVALKVIDSQKKVLVSGVYDSGKSLKVTGIPPLRVQLSDSQAVKISYQGGKVVVPKGKQVTFELPMR